MSTAQQNRSHPYLMGIITGISVTVAAATLMGQTYDKKPTSPTTPAGTPSPKPAEPPAGAPMGAVAADVDQYFVTQGNASGNSAKLWKRPAGKAVLEFILEAQANSKGRGM